MVLECARMQPGCCFLIEEDFGRLLTLVRKNRPTIFEKDFAFFGKEKNRNCFYFIFFFWAEPSFCLSRWRRSVWVVPQSLSLFLFLRLCLFLSHFVFSSASLTLSVFLTVCFSLSLSPPSRVRCFPTYVISPSLPLSLTITVPLSLYLPLTLIYLSLEFKKHNSAPIGLLYKRL